MDDVIHIHEDDWGMRTLYPAVTQRKVEQDLAAAQKAGQDNRESGGRGWTAVYVIRASAIDYVQTRLRLTDAVAALGVILPRVKRFYADTGYSVEPDPARRDPLGSYDDDAWCFGHRQCYLKLEHKEGFVSEIWYDFASSDPQDADALRQAFAAIDRIVPSLVADYWIDAQGLISDRAFLDRYFRKLRATVDSGP